MKNSFAASHRTSKRNEKLFRFKGFAPREVFGRLPQLHGERIDVSFLPYLTAHRGKLLSRSPQGDAVYAGSFLRKRRIVLEEQMLRTPRVLERIFVHEVFHFVWSRLGAPLRSSFEQLITSEIDRGARGELGWSAEVLKQRLTWDDRDQRTRRWKDYLCESFCDTAGWLFGSARRYSEMTLARKHREARRRWFQRHVLPRPLSI